MMSIRQTLSTKQLAEAIGVSESSVKRWADDGALAVVRTVGGHRRIPLAEAVRFVRETRATVVRPAALGLPGTVAALDTDADRLAAALAGGRAAEVRGMLHGLYLRGRSVASIVDGPLRTAMERLGARWLHDPDGILVEHRATDICLQWLNQLRALLVVADDAPTAVGGAPPCDPYALPTLAVATALEAEGFRAINLGPETPLETLALAVRREGASIAWLSVSTDEGRRHVESGLARLAKAAGAAGTRLIVGGRALHAKPIETPADVQVAAMVAEAAAFGRGLRAVRESPGRSRVSRTT